VPALCADGGLPQGIEPQARRCDDFLGARLSPAAAGGNDKTLDRAMSIRNHAPWRERGNELFYPMCLISVIKMWGDPGDKKNNLLIRCI
jgi:hypothetical protein